MGVNGLDLKDLKSFEMVYETRSINRAAKKLYITPQGLGNVIKTLEKELDTVLFERDKQDVRPTASAQLLHKRSFSLIHQFEEIQNEMEQLKCQEVRLRIGCACGAFNVLPFEHIRTFMKQNEQIQVELCEYSNEEVKKLLMASQLEYGFVIGDWKEASMEICKLASITVYLIIYEGHPFWNLKEVTLEMLQDEPLILLNEHFTMYHDIRRSCQVRGFEPKVIAKTADINFQHKLCRKKMGLAVLPDFIIDDFDMTHLKAIPFKEQLRWDVYGACEKAHAHYKVIEKFKAFIEYYTLMNESHTL